MPTSILATLLSQLLFLYTLGVQTPELCATPVSHRVAGALVAGL